MEYWIGVRFLFNNKQRKFKHLKLTIMSVKGTVRENTSVANEKFVGFTRVEVVAVNPTREELNKILDREAKDDDKEIEYVTEDREGNERVQLVFWLYDKKIEKHFRYSFTLTNKERVSKDGLKKQFINSTSSTAWADHEDNLFEWFKNFQDKEKENIGEKDFRPALIGEEELAVFVRAWLGRMNWNNTDAYVMIDTKPLFKGDFSELQGLIDGDFDAPFVILLGVRTDPNDSEKQYQQVFGKAFLPGSFMENINKGFKFPTDYGRKTYAAFEKATEGEYGFDAYFELEPIKEYDKEKDITAAGGSKAEEGGVTPNNKKF